MRTKYISVNKHVIRSNAVRGENEPPIRVARGKAGKAVYGHRVDIDGPSRLVYDAEKPLLKCGARLVVETEAKVQVFLYHGPKVGLWLEAEFS